MTMLRECWNLLLRELGPERLGFAGQGAEIGPAPERLVDPSQEARDPATGAAQQADRVPAGRRRILLTSSPHVEGLNSSA